LFPIIEENEALLKNALYSVSKGTFLIWWIHSKRERKSWRKRSKLLQSESL
jgi:hypothetical protein